MPKLEQFTPSFRPDPRQGVFSDQIYEEATPLAIRVQVKDNEPVEKAMRRLKRLCNNEGVDRRFKSRKFYEKPSERRRRKAKERMKTIRLANRARGMA